MNTLYALIILFSLMLSVSALLALVSRNFRPRALKTLAICLPAFVISMTLFTPDKPVGPRTTVVSDTSKGSLISPVDPAAAVRSAPPSFPGVARICLTDDDVQLGQEEITIPATTVFEDDGPNSGKIGEPATWAYEVKEGSFFHAALITMETTVVKQHARCAETKVQMLTDSQWTAMSQTAAEHHVFAMTDVINYPIPRKLPRVEVGKLIDDISVKAILVTDVTQAMPAAHVVLDETTKAAQCLASAKRLAGYVGGGVGRQTSMMVSLGGIAPDDASYGCASGPRNTPDLYVGWQGQAKPPTSTVSFIVKAGEYLTGATQAELRSETAACVRESLKPDSGETANREFRGVKIECQAFARDGAGGSVTIYRRFGVGPEHGEPSPTTMAAVDSASSVIKEADDKKASDNMKFAEWFLDPSIPKEVKTFAMMVARVVTLGERCPSVRPRMEKIAKWAADVGVTTDDIQPGGRYASLMAMMMSEMRAGVAKESVEEACENARRYQ